jgi:hypothetical protein
MRCFPLPTDRCHAISRVVYLASRESAKRVLAIYSAHREGSYLERKTKQIDIKEFADRIGRRNDFFGGHDAG